MVRDSKALEKVVCMCDDLKKQSGTHLTGMVLVRQKTQINWFHPGLMSQEIYDVIKLG